MCAAPSVPPASSGLLNRLKDTVLCAICKDVMTDPVEACAKKHNFCRICIMQAAEYRPKCPLCRDNLLPMGTLQTNRLAQQNIEIYQEELQRLEREAKSLAERTQPSPASNPISINPAALISREPAAAVTLNPISAAPAALPSATVVAQAAPVSPPAPISVPWSPIFAAVRRGDEEAVKRYIQGGESVNQVDQAGNNPIFYAKTNSMVELLLRAGARIRRVPPQPGIEQNDRFFESINTDNLVVAKELLENGLCDIEAYNEQTNKTAFFLAMEKSPMMMLLLIRAGADIEYTTAIPNQFTNRQFTNRTTPLFHILALMQFGPLGYKDCDEKIEILLRAGANVHAQGPGHVYKLCRVAFVVAARVCNLRVLELFLQHGANINTSDGEATALHHACNRGNNFEMVKFLLERGANITVNGNPPLHYAVHGGCVQAAELLLNAGANKNAKDNRGATPLNYACGFGECRIEMIRFLLRRRANVNLPNKYGNSPLSLACRAGSSKIAQLLIEHGADIHFRDEDGVTPLEYMQRNRAVFGEILAKINT
ncbi:MAG TPA: ankyrin repeat domain-containing protein, partial [Rhabdochlamydiaceae bacterium]|nr:ankyrin repeat domain-containing protein [Rhabdochlamydiaceae bacterium]